MEIFFATQQISIPEIFLYMIQFMVILLFSLSFHESAHAFMAYKCGDDTARLMGRMTLNPIVHIDPIGTLLLPGIMIAMSLMGSSPFLFGWAKPVPVNPLNFRDYRKGELLVSLAGPFSNLILVAGGALICRALLIIDFSGKMIGNPFFIFFIFFTSLNAILFLFNLIPIPPLDGSHVLKLFLSRSAAETYNRVIAPYGFLIIIGLIYFGVLGFLFSIVLSGIELVVFYGVGG